MRNDSSAEPRKVEKKLWVKLCIDFFDDPDLMEAGVEAELLFVRGLAWAKRTNDGFIARGALIRLGLSFSEPEIAVAELVKRDLWQEVKNGWLITNWSEFQVTDEQLENKKAAGVLANHHRWHKEKISSSCIHCSSDSDSVRIQELELELELEKDVTNAPGGFDEFWLAYPRKVGIGDARKAWKQTDKVRPGLEMVLGAVKVLAAEKREAKFVPHPATWLRGHRWADNQEQVAPVAVLRPCNECVGTGRADYGGEAGKEVCRVCGGGGKVPPK